MTATAEPALDLSPVVDGEDRILVFDFGSQTAQLIARRVREQGVLCQIVRPDLPVDRVRELSPKGLILSGGPASVYADGAPQPDAAIFDLGVPVLGICYGMQVLCRAMGCDVKPGASREFGRTEITVGDDSAVLFAGTPTRQTVWMSHGDQVEGLDERFIPVAMSDTCPAAAVRHKTEPVFGLQFHPEVTHTAQGGDLLKNFVIGVCGCGGTWRLASLIDRVVDLIRRRVGDDRVICGLSGGVDSSVTAA
ncbi:MAG: glutamine-hydrolyzing GMP synthase, partial [Planctomycetota bacterium]